MHSGDALDLAEGGILLLIKQNQGTRLHRSLPSFVKSPLLRARKRTEGGECADASWRLLLLLLGEQKLQLGGMEAALPEHEPQARVVNQPG